MNKDIYTDRAATVYSAAAIIVVLVMAVAVWWYTATDVIPLVPNTGATSSDPLIYNPGT